MRVLENNYGWNPVETAPLDKDVTLEVTDGRDARQISSITQSEDSVTFRESVGPGVYSSVGVDSVPPKGFAPQRPRQHRGHASQCWCLFGPQKACAGKVLAIKLANPRFSRFGHVMVHLIRNRSNQERDLRNKRLWIVVAADNSL
jgi:hypothetical protein